ncbi:hypothetical protein GCM10011320_21250 [Neoroseomonas lacus]|uniref:Uncharacterized protein n=1 Tax=Neoroseomonas lacus TaxID=287609 RepID=A0A917KH06_9PROT|nr:hypothetical protein GCM10011320_21250 [Neoroseomonas lacus]
MPASLMRGPGAKTAFAPVPRAAMWTTGEVEACAMPAAVSPVPEGAALRAAPVIRIAWRTTTLNHFLPKPDRRP